MKVLILSPQPFFTARGTPINIRQILFALSQAEHEVTLLCYPLGQDLKIENVEVKRSLSVPFISSIKPGPSFKKIVLDFFFFFSALKLILSKKYDVYHGVEEAGFIAGFFSIFTKKPFIFDVDSSMSSQLEESGFIKYNFLISAFKSVEKFFFNRATKVLTVCSALSKDVLKLCPNANICQIEDFPASNTSKDEFSLKDTYKIDKKIILYAGNFEPYQGVELLINSYSKINKEVRDKACLVLVGKSNNKIESLVSNLKLEDEVIFTGHIANKFMPSIHKQANVLVSPRLSGVNTPLKIYTYMDSERLIVATDIYSHTQVLNSECALLAKANVEDFSIALENAFEKEHSEKISKAKDLVETRYSIKRFNKEILKLYSEIVNKV